MSTAARRAIALVSGGVDSATALAIAKAEGLTVHALTFRYGQRHHTEVRRAREVARQIGVASHVVVDIDLRAIGGSALTSDLPVPKDRSDAEIGDGIPTTYVPARNTIFLSYALAWAEVLPAEQIVIGVNAVDYSGYPDCRPEYIAAFQAMANLATKAGVEGTSTVKIVAPLISLTKGEIIRRGLGLGVDYALTSSCYEPSDDGEACGRCDSCRIRLKGFAEAGVPDPIRYATIPT